MITTMEVYKTSDGKVFSSKELAESHESTIQPCESVSYGWWATLRDGGQAMKFEVDKALSLDEVFKFVKESYPMANPILVTTK